MKTIVIVENDYPTVEFISGILQHSFPDAFEIKGDASNLATAKELIQLHRPDILFLDIELDDGENGLELCEFCSVDTEIIVMSGHFGRHITEAIDRTSSKPVAMFNKPINPDKFEATMSNLLQSDSQEILQNLQFSIEKIHAKYLQE